MKNIRKNALKIMVLVALFAPAAFADGDMGGGGLADTRDGTKGVTVVINQGTEDEGDMGGGGKTSDEGYVDSITSAIYDYLKSIM